MPPSLGCVQYMVGWQVYLQHQQYMFGVKSLFMVEKVLLMRKNLVAVLFRRPMQRSQRSILSCGLTGVWWDKCLNGFGQCVENKTLKCLTFKHISNLFTSSANRPANIGELSSGSYRDLSLFPCPCPFSYPSLCLMPFPPLLPFLSPSSLSPIHFPPYHPLAPSPKSS